MSNAPVVSVCIANYNGVSMIADCIDSVIAQQGKIAIEILVHDDASTDGSVVFIEEHYPQVKLITSPDNVGFCIANNRMAAIAKGKYLLLLNNDAALFPDAISILLSEAENLPQPAILSLPQYGGSGKLLDIGNLLDLFLNPVPNLDPALEEVGMVIGACLWIPKSLWDDLGGFPEWFGSIGEDLYLCCLARLRGHSVRALSTSGYRHHVGQSFGGGKVQEHRLSTTYRRRALSEQNKTFVMALCYPLPLLVLLPLHLVLLLIEGALLSLLKWSWRPITDIYLPVPLACWRERKRLFQLRRQVQTARHISMSKFMTSFRWLPHKLVMLFKHGLPKLT